MQSVGRAGFLSRGSREEFPSSPFLTSSSHLHSLTSDPLTPFSKPETLHLCDSPFIITLESARKSRKTYLSQLFVPCIKEVEICVCNEEQKQ